MPKYLLLTKDARDDEIRDLENKLDAKLLNVEAETADYYEMRELYLKCHKSNKYLIKVLSFEESI